jgi:hypothetical protein
MDHAASANQDIQGNISEHFKNSGLDCGMFLLVNCI